MDVIDRIVRAGANGLVLVTLGLGLAMALVIYGPLLLAQVRVANGIAAMFPTATVVLALFALAAYISRRRRPLDIKCYLLGYSVVFAVVHLAFFRIFQPQPVSDFGSMWGYAVEIARTGQPIDVGESIIYQRAVPFLYPLARLFGPEAIVYQIGNSAILLLASFLAYDILRRQYSHQVGQAFLLLALVTPDLVMATGIPSHDVTGLFGLVLFLWTFLLAYEARVCTRWDARWIRSVCPLVVIVLLAGELVWLEMQRQTAMFAVGGVAVVLAMDFFAGLRRRGLRRKQGRKRVTRTASVAVFYLAVPFLLLQAAKPLLNAQDLVISKAYEDWYRNSWIIAHADSYAPGDWLYGTFMISGFVDGQAFPAVRDLALHKTASDLADHFLKRPLNYAAKAATLFQLGGSQLFYTTVASEREPAVVGLKQRLWNYNLVFFVAVSGLGLLSILYLLAIRGMRPGKYLLVYPVALMALAFIVLGEVQPRYIFPLWFAVPVIIAVGLRYAGRSIKRAGVAPLANLRRTLSESALGVGLILAVYVVGILGLKAAYGIPQGRIIADWDRVVSNTGISEEGLDRYADGLHGDYEIAPIKRSLGKLATTMKAQGIGEQGDFVQLEKEICLGPSDRRTFSFYFFPQAVDEQAAGTLFAAVSVNGRRVWREDLGKEEKIKYVSIPEAVPSGQCSTIAVRLEAGEQGPDPSPGDDAGFHMIFPRLVVDR